jgi:hypothetical protein
MLRSAYAMLAVVLMGCPGAPSESDGGSSAGTGPCGLASNPEPNDTRDTATPVALRSDVTYCLEKDDVDFFAFSTPEDVTGGTVQLEFTQVGTTLRLDVEVTAASDNGVVTSAYRTTEGASLTMWFSVQPGTAYKARVRNFAGSVSAATKYNLNVLYTPVADTFEPNDTRDTAKPLTLGTTANAYFSGGFSVSDAPNAAFDDWYSVSVAAGRPIRVLVANVATDWRPQVEIFAPDNSSFESKYVTTEGQSLDVKSADMVAAAGTYKIRVYAFAGYPKAEGDGALADHLTRPYAITVTQP